MKNHHRISASIACFLLAVLGLSLKALAITPMATPMARVGARKQAGGANFYLKDTGGAFYARGANYTRLSNQPNGNQYHNTFDRGTYDAAGAESSLREMQAYGYNYVRVFLTSYNKFGLSSPGVDPTWLSNVADFIARASSHHIYIVLAGEWLPDNYNSIAYEQGTPANVTGTNLRLFMPGYAKATGQFWTDVLTGIKALNPNLLSAIFSIDVSNECYVDLSEKPLSSNSGTVTAWGVTYDMSVNKDRQQLIDTSSVEYINTISEAIKSVDPQILVGLSAFTPLAAGHSGFDGAKIPLPGSEMRYPVNEVVLMKYSKADYMDIHVYPLGQNYSLSRDLSSAEITPYMSLTKPLIMGEFGALKSIYSTEKTATSMLHDLLSDSCAYGFSGWGLWTWNTTEQAQGWWTGAESNGAVSKVIAPSAWPQICR